MRVLVTGSTSLLGSCVARRLAERGDSVTVLQRSPGVLGLPEVLGDVADPEVVDRAVRGQDAVVHLAARVGVVGSREQFERTNVGGTRAVLDAMRRHDVARLVHVSSPSVAHAGQPLMGAGADPADPRAARGHYSRTKATAELLALGSGLPEVLAVRPHLVWGPGDTQLVGRIVERARQGRLALVGGGTALVDTTYVDNAADAIVASLDRAPAAAGHALVVSNGEPRTVAEMFGRILAAAGVESRLRRVPATAASGVGAAAEALWAVSRREDDPPMTRFLAEQLSTAHWFDQRQTRALLDWAPAVRLDEGFERLRLWFHD